MNDWLANPYGSRFFLITGEPGSGKTAIASRLAQFALRMVPLPDGLTHLTPDFLSAIHFCSTRDSRWINPLTFAESVAMQLAERYQVYANALVEKAENQQIKIEVTKQFQNTAGGQGTGVAIKSLNVRGTGPEDAFNRLVREPLEACFRQQFNQQVIILVDALDEALGYPGNVDIVSLLARAVNLPPNIRFIVSTRLDPRVLSLLQPSREISLTSAFGLSHSLADVREYIYSRLQGVADPRREALAEQIFEAAQGNFLYARFALDDLLSDPERIGNHISLQLPGSLFEHYEQVIERISAGNTQLWMEDYRPLLGTLAVAYSDGLTRVQLAGILGFSNSQTYKLLRDCAQLLSSQGSADAFRIYHQSFRDYLLSDGMYQIDSANANLAIARYFLNAYGDRWLDCEDDYALRYTPAHILEAARQSNREGANKELIDILANLLNNLDFMKAKIERNGVEPLLTDLKNALRLFPPMSDQSRQLLLKMLAFGTTLAQTGQWEQAEAIWTEIEAVARAIGDRAQRDRILYSLGTALAKAEQWERAEAVMGAIEDKRQRGIALNDLGTVLAQAGQQVRAEAVWTEARVLMGERGTTTNILKGHNGPVRALTVTPDGRRVISGSEDHTLKVWDLTRGEELRTLTGHRGAVTSVAVTPDALLVLSGSDDSTVKVWELATGRLLVNLVHEGAVNAVVITPDGHYVLSGSDDSTLRVWDLATGNLVHNLSGHTGFVHTVMVTSDGRFALSSFDDLTLKVWNLQIGSEEYTFSGHDGPVFALTITPDGPTRCATSC